MSFTIYNTNVYTTLEAAVPYIGQIASNGINGTDNQIDITTNASGLTFSLANPTIIKNLAILTGGGFQFEGGPNRPIINDVLTCLDTVGTVGWTRAGGGGGGVTSITGTANQITASAATGAVTLSLPAIVDLNNIKVNNMIISSLTNSQVVATDGGNNLVSLAYTPNATASTLVERDATGNFAAAKATLTGFQLTTAPTAGFVLTSDGAGNGTWAAGGVTSITGTANQITASAATGDITLSIPDTIDLNTVNISSLTASQAVVTDINNNLVSLAYTPNNVQGTIVSRSNVGAFSGSTITASTTLQVGNGGALVIGNSDISNNTFTFNGWTLENPNNGSNFQVLNLEGGVMGWSFVDNFVATSGTFTPSVSFSGGSTGLNVTASGNYTRIGVAGSGTITIFIYIAFTAVGSSAGTLLIGNLPYASFNGLPQSFSTTLQNIIFPTGATSAVALFNNVLTTTLNIEGFSGTSTAQQFTNTNLQNNSIITISGTYLF